ncbi:hypothetical protein [Bacillus phage BM-P1]|nr:hypothetical protein [Bacillus phage BM-P1]
MFNLPSGAGNFNRARSIMAAMASETDGASSKLNDVISKIQEVNKLDRRSESLTRRASASNYMSYQQATSFRKDYKTVNQDYHADKRANIDAMTLLGQERTELTRKIKEIKQIPTHHRRTSIEK